jgi:cell division septation protein DedD
MRQTQRRKGATAQRRSGFGVAWALSLGALLPTVLPFSNLTAQSDPRLAAAVRLAQDGLSDSARAVVGRILGSLQPADSLYAEALYTMGFLAATEADRRLHLRRVVVDYAQSEWADDALLQLAQLDYAVGNTEATVRQIEILLRDYPATPVAGIAAFWGARAAGDRRDAAAACRMADAGLLVAGSDVELRNQLEFQKQRCQGIASMAAESTRSPAPPSRRPAEEPPGRTPTRAVRSGYFVQVSAVRTQAAANTEIARIKRAGYTAIVVRESGLLKVRVGAFRTKADADAAASEIRIRIGARPFVVRVP